MALVKRKGFQFSQDHEPHFSNNKVVGNHYKLNKRTHLYSSKCAYLFVKDRSIEIGINKTLYNMHREEQSNNYKDFINGG